MNGYQKKRIDGCLKKAKKLTIWETSFLTSIVDMPVTPWGKKDDSELTENQNHKLNEIAQRLSA